MEIKKQKNNPMYMVSFVCIRKDVPDQVRFGCVEIEKSDGQLIEGIESVESIAHDIERNTGFSCVCILNIQRFPI